METLACFESYTWGSPPVSITSTKQIEESGKTIFFVRVACKVGLSASTNSPVMKRVRRAVLPTRSFPKMHLLLARNKNREKCRNISKDAKFLRYDKGLLLFLGGVFPTFHPCLYRAIGTL